MSAPLVKLALFFLSLSLVAVGGAFPILPVIHAEVVDNHWVDDAGFAQIVTLAQALPGPNFLYIPLLGWIVGGAFGTLVAIAAFIGPSGALAVAAGRTLRHHAERPAVQALRRAMRPIACGALTSGGLLLAWAFARGRLADVAVVAAVAVAAARLNIGTLWYIAAAGVVGTILAMHG